MNDTDRIAALDAYRGVAAQIDYVWVEAHQHQYGEVSKMVKDLAPDLTQDDLNRLVPAVIAEGFERHGFHGGCTIITDHPAPKPGGVPFKGIGTIAATPDGGFALTIPEKVEYTWNSEYAGWYTTYALEPGTYPVVLIRGEQGNHTNGWKLTYYPAGVDDADCPYVDVPAVIVAGDAQSRFGGVRTGTDPMLKKIGKPAICTLYTGKDVLRAAAAL